MDEQASGLRIRNPTRASDAEAEMQPALHCFMRCLPTLCTQIGIDVKLWPLEKTMDQLPPEEQQKHAHHQATSLVGVESYCSAPLWGLAAKV
eukprot:650007-Amphidinium_carterae.1